MIAAEQGSRSFDAASDTHLAQFCSMLQISQWVLSPIVALSDVLFHCDRGWSEAREPQRPT